MSGDNYEITEDGKKILKKIPFTGIKRTIARNLEESWNTAVTSGGWVKADCSAVKELKNKLKEQGIKVTYTDIFVKLLASAVSEHPMMNSSLVDKKIVLYKSVNVGIGYGDEDGNLLVPVIREVQDKSVVQVSQEIKDVTARIKNGTVTMEDFTGGTISISSLGMFECYGFSQVLVQPQSAILGFGTIHDEPWVLEDKTIGIKPIMHISISLDHRIIQGVTSSVFMMTLLNMFADPEKYMGL